MMQRNLTKLKTAAAWGAIFVTGVTVGWLAGRNRDAALLAELIEDARRSVVALNPSDLRGLAGAREDQTTAGYAVVKAALQKLRAVDPRVRFVYVFRSRPETGTVIYLADSAPPGARDESLPGDVYPQAEESPGLQAILRTGQPATEGPLADDFGTWITAYAPISETPSAHPTLPARDVLGLDIDAATWSRRLWLAGLQGAFVTWIVLGLPFGALLIVRRQREQREVIRNLSEAMEQSHSAILIVDLEHHIEYANRGLCRQMGYSRRELIGRNWRDFRGAETPEEVFTDLFATVRAGRAWEGEWFNARKDGSAYPVRGGFSPVKHRDGSLACYVAVFEDVTDFKRREAELREARDLAEAGDRAKGQFLATMSHEVRTPLNGIVGFTSLLLDTTLSPEQHEYVQTIRASGEALIQLTGDILDFARIESGKLKLELLACDPREVVEDAFDLLAARATEKNLELLHRCGEDVPAAVVADAGRLRQVLVNLLGNAIKFTERGEIQVKITRVREGAGPKGGGQTADDGRQGAEGGSDSPVPASDVGPPSSDCLLEFSVRDTGIGIPADQYKRLFKPFSQLDDSSTRRYGGTGLGLAICRNMVQLMGGEIKVASEVGRGSVFTFTIRVAASAPQPPVRNLGGMRVGLAMPPGSLRREMAALLTGWQARVTAVDRAADLTASPWDAGLVAVDETTAREFAGQAEPNPGLPAQKLIGLVPISLSSELRTALRRHFRLLVNKPVHHSALFELLTGARTSVPSEGAPLTQFGFKVLLVEDNPMNQRLMQRVLANLGCLATVVDNGRRALEELTQRADDYDLVVLDLHMPEMDGLTALQEIRRGRAGPRAQSIWIMALTAEARDEERARGLAAGLDDYLTKPLQLPEFQAALRRFRTERGKRRP